MAARFSTSDLGRILRGTASPAFALDDLGRLIFVNPALAELLKAPETDLLGKHVQFSSTGATPLEELLNRLAPPPEVFAGQSMTGRIVFAADTSELAAPSSNSPNPTTAEKVYQVHWIPLRNESGEAAVVIGVLERVSNSAAASFGTSSKKQTWHERLINFRATAKQQFRLAALVGNSPAAKIAQQQAFHAVKSSSSLIITGPVGIGKKTLARAIHYAGATREDTLIELDCATLNSAQSLERLNSAIASSESRLKTLLISEIHLLSSEAQSLLATAIRKQPSWRIIATSTLDPSVLLSKSSSQDLLMMLSTMNIVLPSLAERPSDIPFYVQSIIEQENLRGGRTIRGCSRDAFERIASYSWPGQLTELRAALTEARAKCAGHEIVATDLPGYLAQAELKTMYPAPATAEPIDLEKTLATVERELLTRALTSAKGNKTAAAQLVGMSRPRFYRRLIELGLVDADSPDQSTNQASEPASNSPSTKSKTPNNAADSGSKPTAESKSRAAARRRKNRKPTPFDDLVSATPDEPEFMDDIPFIPTDEANEDEE